jgi:2-dehydropantoate 2-reductase
MTNIKPLWHIAGIGALGSVLATSFFQAGHTVRLLLKNKRQLITYQNTQLTMSSSNHTFSCHPEAITIQQLSQEPIHYLMCCVKAHDITPLLWGLKHRLNQQSVILIIHNGIGVLDEIKKRRPDLRIISGCSTIGAYLEKPFTVTAFLEGTLSLGSSIGLFSPMEITTIDNAFKMTNLSYQWEENIQKKTWEKFAINCSINLLTALLNCKNGELLQHDLLLTNMTNEVSQVLQAYNVNLLNNQLKSKVIETIKYTANNYSSTYKDIQLNRRTEMEYLNGQLVQLAQKKQIPTPIISELLAQFYQRFPPKKKRRYPIDDLK